ncbi:MAG: 23S rRNA (adenine(2503)-C(2))-methyltransferase RlmN [Acutalibacteraceae bacterium]|nr:23S rRNA (adenine(2503)-C(2))-methyltransferase RlmN [Acutalibacteraceae bacterium]
MKDLKSMTLPEIEEVVLSLSQPKFRAKQIFDWMQKGIDDFCEMKNVPKSLIDELKKEYYISYAKIEKKFCSKLDETVKYLFRLYDGELIESVVMKYKHGYSICVSSQVGCNMGCKFCASTIGGKLRNLTAGEILSQIYTASKDLSVRISNVVMMGMGEPLDNFDEAVRFLELVGMPGGLNIGMRHISLSTCGVVDKIYKLMELDSQITLSISLHAPFDDMRDSIMPINHRYKIAELMKACKTYTDKTGRRISFEYALIKGFNDTPECAEKLRELLGGMLAHINLIPANPVHKGKFEKPDKKSVYAFCELLNKKGLNATVRRTLGSDIDASCGQLRAKHSK